MTSRLRGEFLRFGIVGTAGFLVDTAALYAALHALGLGLYGGRVFSYLVAATFTWAMNRRFTFKDAAAQSAAGQWGKFVAANAVGAVVNYATYAALVTYVSIVAAYPVLGVAAGSIAGLVFNFAASKRFVFRAGPG